MNNSLNESKKARISKNFTVDEFKCKCGRAECDAPIQPPPLHVNNLEKMREFYGKPMIPTSWARCAFWNKKEGGGKRSQHLKANATDFKCYNGIERHKMAFAAMKAGLTVIVYSWGIHVDSRPGEPLLLPGKP